jgi:hypothetical protein
VETVVFASSHPAPLLPHRPHFLQQQFSSDSGAAKHWGGIRVPESAGTGCLGKSKREVLLGGVCLPDLLKFHLKFGPLAPADYENMQVGQQADRPA